MTDAQQDKAMEAWNRIMARAKETEIAWTESGEPEFLPPFHKLMEAVRDFWRVREDVRGDPPSRPA